MAKQRRAPAIKARRMTIYVKSELRQEMLELEGTWAISWSRIASEAFRQECERLKKQQKKLGK